MKSRIRILIAEDDLDEQDFVKEGLENSTFFEILTIVPNGKLLLQTLERLDKKSLPDMILSDVNMPLVNGLEALTKIKSNPSFATIPVVIFTTSSVDCTKEQSYILGADYFLVKPSSMNYDAFALKLKGFYETFKVKDLS
jgi:CheY-like chemotaxis protein